VFKRKGFKPSPKQEGGERQGPKDFKKESGGRLKTLDRVISQAGVASRAEARSWIAAGRIAVNGQVIRHPEHWLDPDKDRVTVEGRPLKPEQKVYRLLYKPKGYLTTAKDPEGRKTVYELMPKQTWLVPVGRLDLDTSGLLLMTNDTTFADFLTDPESHVPKTYLVKTASPLSDEQIEMLRNGVDLNDGPTRPAIVERTGEEGTKGALEITITEGRNRQVRRMIEAVGSKVRKLVRIALGPLRLGDLVIGQWRDLQSEEVEALRRAGSKPKPGQTRG
jgi:23S rRNA pseudouridine2605 synthase